MSQPLNLRFPDPDRVSVRLGDEQVGPLAFHNPLTPKDHQDLRWYVETYGAHSLGDPDDSEAARIKAKLPDLGKALFQAVFQNPEAQCLYAAFLKASPSNRLLTLDSSEPAILALPWELLHDPQAPAGTHLFHQHVNFRRRLDAPPSGLRPLALRERAKPRLHCLFVISRPVNAGFINPRADAQAVLDALAQMPGRVTTEFLYPPDLEALARRLQDSGKPAVDILHFDGHGGFDPVGRFVSANTGYLLFENGNSCQPHPVPGQLLGGKLQARPPALVILSACQSATQGEESLGSVAAALLAAGIPAVLAMTHKVLVKTTEAFFGAFYQALGAGQALGQALNQARDHLDKNPEKAKVRRGQDDWLPLQLHDWFVPSLYQNGEDLPLLEAKTDPVAKTESVLADKPPADSIPSFANDPVPPFAKGGQGGISNLPEPPQAGFHGRTLELWQIERGFAAKTRRIAITGFGGQGKTALAQEAARWLLRTGQFQAAAFVTYAGLQTLDSVAIALNTLGEVLGESFPDPAAALEALRKTPTLLILDNLETLPAEAFKELLGSAVEWSKVGGSRVLLTSRSPDFQHPAYPVAGGLDYLRLSLSGLGSREYPDDALAWFGELIKRPPEFAFGLSTPRREELVGLFDKVGFHPLSIHILAVQLKNRRVEELGERLEQLLLLPSPCGGGAGGEGAPDEDVPQGLAASLQLSLDRLEPEARALLPRLGVFQGGALEPNLLEIIGLDAPGWAALRQQLESAALIETESLLGVKPPFLRFHPVLAPLLWRELNNITQAQLSAAHRVRYGSLAETLYHKDERDPHFARTIIRFELQNLLHAVHAMFQLTEPEAAIFADRMSRFLNVLGMEKEREKLTLIAMEQLTDNDSQAWLLAQFNRGDQLFDSGQFVEAGKIFHAMFERLNGTVSYDLAVVLGRMGRCLLAFGLADGAVQTQQLALNIVDGLESSDYVKRQRGACLADQANALVAMGQYVEANQIYQASLAIIRELGDISNQGALLGQLGTLALLQDQFSEAIQYYREALGLFQMLQDLTMEANIWSQLGVLYQKTQQLDESERCYRKASSIKDALGDKSGAAIIWQNLAIANARIGKPKAAESWFRKAIAMYKTIAEDEDQADKNSFEFARTMLNLAELLRTQPNRLIEARRLAEEALDIKQKLEPGMAEIWKPYAVLAEIAEQDAITTPQISERRQAAKKYRRLSLGAYRAFPGNKVLLRQHASLILVACEACITPFTEQATAMLTEYQASMYRGAPDWMQLAEALDRLRSGERNAEVLLDKLNCEKALILETILQGIANPASLDWLKAETAESS